MRGRQLVRRFETWSLILTLALLLAAPFKLHAAEDDLYDFLWLDPDKSVYVLQNKVHKKAGSTYVQLGYLMGLTNEYQDVAGVQLATGHYFNEEWALELVYNLYNNDDNEAMQNLRTINGSVPFVRKVEKVYGAMAVWAPFYGKINTFNKIIYFDWSFGAGPGLVQTESNALSVATPSSADVYRDEKNFALLTKTNLRIHASKRVHLDLQYFRVQYRAPGPTLPSRPGLDAWRSNADIIFSIGFSF
jgi:outer membrane beta-barrel protein